MIGKILIYAGIVLIIFGVIVLNFDKFGWLGKLPGDIRIVRGNFTFYFPITSGILISVLVSLTCIFFQKLR
ncbi:MAG: DUF2905 domain-containing protein [Marinoscillum sp.]